MTCVPCVVRPSGETGWVAQIEGKEFGPYHSRDMALRVAIADALLRRRAGRAARVVVKDEQGAIRAKRCLCASFGR